MHLSSVGASGSFLAMTLKKRSVAIELRLRAEAEARKEAAEKLKLIMIRFSTGTLAIITLLALVALDVLAVAEPVIEEVHGAAQLEKLLEDKDFVAVLWTSRNCRYRSELLNIATLFINFPGLVKLPSSNWKPLTMMPRNSAWNLSKLSTKGLLNSTTSRLFLP